MDNEIKNKIKSRREFVKKFVKNQHKPFIKINRSGIKEIQEWLRNGKQGKFDIKHFQSSSKSNHWTEKINIDNMFEIVVEVYGSEPKQEKNWIKIIDINNLTGVDLDISSVQGKKFKRELVRDIIKKVEENYGKEINNNFSEIERKLF